MMIRDEERRKVLDTVERKEGRSLMNECGTWLPLTITFTTDSRHCANVRSGRRLCSVSQAKHIKHSTPPSVSRRRLLIGSTTPVAVSSITVGWSIPHLSPHNADMSAIQRWWLPHLQGLLQTIRNNLGLLRLRRAHAQLLRLHHAYCKSSLTSTSPPLRIAPAQPPPPPPMSMSQLRLEWRPSSPTPVRYLPWSTSTYNDLLQQCRTATTSTPASSAGTPRTPSRKSSLRRTGRGSRCSASRSMRRDTASRTCILRR